MVCGFSGKFLLDESQGHLLFAAVLGYMIVKYRPFKSCQTPWLRVDMDEVRQTPYIKLRLNNIFVKWK